MSPQTVADSEMYNHALDDRYDLAKLARLVSTQRFRLTAAMKMRTLSMPSSSNPLTLVPKRVATVRTMTHMKIQLATTTYGPWSLGVMTPCGGKEPPLEENERSGGNVLVDIFYEGRRILVRHEF